MGIKIIAKNKRSSFDYQILDTFEAGLSLKGTEVKSLRLGKVTLAESFVVIDKNEEVWIQNMNIAHYSHGNIHNHEESRKRKLLLNKKEIKNLIHESKAGGLTIIPTKIYFKGSYVKLEIALARGKKIYDKRQDQAKKDAEKKLRRGQYD